MEIKTNITKHDLVEFQLFELARSPKARYWRLACALLPAVLVLGVSFWIQGFFGPKPVQLWELWVALLLILPLYLLVFYRVAKRRLEQKLDRSLIIYQIRSALGDHLISLTPEGVTVDRESGQFFTPWEEVPRVLGNGDYCYIYTHPESALIIPRRSFPDDGYFRAFVKTAVIFHWHNEHAMRDAAATLAAATPAATV